MSAIPSWQAQASSIFFFRDRMTVDPVISRIFMVERGLGGDINAAVVHVWHIPGIKQNISHPGVLMLLLDEE